METNGSHGTVYYHQGCPVCGRLLRVRVELLGRRVYCQHCGGGFLATDPALRDPHGSECRPARSTVDELLEKAAVVLEQAGR